MTGWAWIIAAAISLNGIASELADAQESLERKNCFSSEKITPDTRISSCNIVIQSGSAIGKDLATAYNNRGVAFGDKGQQDRAIKDFDQAIKLNPTNPFAFNNRANQYGNKGLHEQSIKDYDQAIKLNQKYSNALNNRGLEYAATKRYDRAIEDFEQAIKVGSLDAWNNICFARAIVGQLEQALADCNQSLRLKPDDALSFSSRGFVHLKLGQFDKAIADYSAALRGNPKDADSLYGRGLARTKKGDGAGGNVDVAAAKALDKAVAETFAGYGVK